MNQFYLVAAIVGVAFVLSFLSTPLARQLAFLLKIVDKPNARKVHLTPTPMLGGLAILIGAFGGLLFAYTQGTLISQSAVHGTVIGMLLIFALGAADDKWGIPPRWKLLGQIIAALVLVFFEIRISLFIQQNVITTFITVIWIVGITNSFNLLDNMNGLSAGVGLIAAFFFGWIAYEQQDIFVLLFSAALFGASLGFLPFNFPKAKIFLGDAGSMLIGFTLAALSVQGIYLASSELTHLPVITPLLILGVPLFDTISVIVIRLSRGLSIFAADKNHFSHRLVDLGMSQRRAVLVIYLVAIAVAIPATLLSHVTREEAAMLLVQELILFVIIVFLMHGGMIRGEERRRGVPFRGHEENREK